MIRFAPLALPLLALPLLAGAARAAELPAFARGPSAETAAASPWKGLSIGVEAIAVGGRGVRGGFGAATSVGWSRTFDNNWSLGLKASAGHLPAIAFAPIGAPGWSARPAGWNFVSTSATVGYDFGNVRPWASVGATFLKPTQFGGARGFDAVNGLFGEPGRTQGVLTYGAGVDFAVSNRLTIGVGVIGAARQ